MISEEALERLSERLVNRIEELNYFMVKKLGDQMVDIGRLTPSQLREVFQSVKYGNNLNEIIEKIADITDKNVKDIYEIFEEVAKECQAYAKQFYEYRNIKYIPFDENKELQNQVKAIAKITANEYMNMSNTSAYAVLNDLGKMEYTSISEVYQKITDRSILNISQGRESYNMVMQRTIRELTKKGLRTVNYASGYSRRLDSSVRMNVMEGVRQLNIELQKQFGEEFGADGIEVSHHKNPAPDHENTVDGKQFSTKGEVTVKGIKYQDFNKINNSLQRPVGTLNCYHFITSIVLGVSQPKYSKEQLDADKKANKEGFEFEGQHYTNYEGTQLQRKIETKIRQYKDRQIGAKAVNDTDEVYHCQEKISQLTQKYNDLSKASGLPTKIERLRVDGYRKVNINKSNNNKVENVNYTDITQEWLENAKPNVGQVIDRNYFVDKNGIKYVVDGKNVVFEPSKDERDMANWLKETFGGNIYLNPKVNTPDNVTTPDYLWNNEFWDLKTMGEKTLSKTRAVDNVIKKAKNQTDNIILDITKNKLENKIIEKQVQKVYSTKGREWVEKIMIVDNYKLIRIYKRNKKRG